MTFLELIVVLGIFGAISATVLFNYSDFSTNVHLQNLAQDVALQIKKAQTDAVSGKTPSLSDSQNQNISALVPADWKPSYGIAFTTTQNLERYFFYFFNHGYADDPDTYEEFDDLAAGSYSIGDCGAGSDSECLDEISITSGDFISLICFGYSEADFNSNFDSIGNDCSAVNGEMADTAHISFTRPRANALIFPIDDGDGRENVFIRITSQKGGHKYISVWQSGYINVR